MPECDRCADLMFHICKTEPPIYEIYFTDNITVYPADAFTPDSITATTVIDEVIGAMSITASAMD